MTILCVYVLPVGGEKAEWYAQRGKEFVESYYTHRAGVQHDLLAILKCGEDDGSARVAWGNYFPKIIIHPSTGWDIGSWLTVASVCDYDYMVCLGANSRILVDDWLAMMLNIIEEDGVGVVGTTASFEAGITHSFPNPHIRTNGFMIETETLQSLSRPIDTKQDCYEFEHGTESMYRQLKAAEQLCPIVGADGMPYVEEEWATSGIYRQGNQSNLLIADNQTDAFMASTEKERLVLSLMAGWHCE